MPTYRYSPEIHMDEPSPSELGYLAGIMDGEGYFACTKSSNTFGMRVAMVDQEVIDWLHDHFAGNVSRAGLTSTGNRVHVWYLQRQADLLYLLPLLIPHLVLKGEQAKAMLALVHHLHGRPVYDRPTKNVPHRERLRRRDIRAAWREQGEALRQAVKAAR